MYPNSFHVLMLSLSLFLRLFLLRAILSRARHMNPFFHFLFVTLFIYLHSHSRISDFCASVLFTCTTSLSPISHPIATESNRTCDNPCKGARCVCLPRKPQVPKTNATLLRTGFSIFKWIRQTFSMPFTRNQQKPHFQMGNSIRCTSNVCARSNAW